MQSTDPHGFVVGCLDRGQKTPLGDDTCKDPQAAVGPRALAEVSAPLPLGRARAYATRRGLASPYIERKAGRTTHAGEGLPPGCPPIACNRRRPGNGPRDGAGFEAPCADKRFLV